MDTFEALEYESLVWGGDHDVVLNKALDKKEGLPQNP